MNRELKDIRKKIDRLERQEHELSLKLIDIRFSIRMAKQKERLLRMDKRQAEVLT